MNKMLTLAMSFVLGSQVVWGQTDSSADARDGFVAEVERSQAVVLKVPINELGEEDTSRAEMRLLTKEVLVESLRDVQTAWDQSRDISEQPVISDDEIVDGSTWGWFGWRSYHRRWAPAYYYSNYRPVYCNYGNYYRYGASHYYSSYSYRYYYYPRYY